MSGPGAVGRATIPSTRPNYTELVQEYAGLRGRIAAAYKTAMQETKKYPSSWTDRLLLRRYSTLKSYELLYLKSLYYQTYMLEVACATALQQQNGISDFFYCPEILRGEPVVYDHRSSFGFGSTELYMSLEFRNGYRADIPKEHKAQFSQEYAALVPKSLQ